MPCLPFHNVENDQNVHTPLKVVRLVRFLRLSSNLLALAPALLVALTLLPVSVYPAVLQDAEAVPGGPVPSDLSRSFDQLWRRYQEARLSGEAEVRQRILNEIRRLRVERNVFHLHDIALAFAFQGSSYLQQGDIAEAKASFQTASELDPTLPTPLFGLARVARASGGFWPLSSLSYLMQGYLAPFQSFWNGYHARADLLLVVTLSLFMAFAVFAAMMLYRYAVLINHDFAERFAARIGQLGVRALTLIVLILPLGLSVGFAWLIPYWLAVTFAHQTRSERALSIVSLIFFMWLGPVLEFQNQWSRTLLNPVFRASISSEAGTFDPTDVVVLQTAIQQHPADRDLKLILATQYKNLGDYETSAALYREILTENPTDPAAQINLGNIYFAQRDWEGAILQYTNVIEDHPDFVLAYYNKSLAHGESFQFSERERARTQAENLDSQAVAAFEERTGGLRAVADVRLGADYIVAKFFGLPVELHPSPPPSVETAVLSSERGAGFALGALALGSLTLLLALVFRNRVNTLRCGKCGSAFCSSCQIGKGRRGLCTQCYHLFIVKDGVSAGARNQKIAQVNRNDRARSVVFRALSLVTPGAGHIAEDKSLLGFLLLVIWLHAAVFLLARSRFYPLLDPTLGVGSSLHVYIGIATLLVGIAVANTMAQPQIRV